MSSPGWYPDPGGAPGQFRYWDGTSWSPTTSDAPSGAPKSESTTSAGPWLIGGIVALVVLAVVLWFVFFNGGSKAPIVEDTNSASPTVSSWDEKNPTSAPPIEVPSNGTMIDCPQTSEGSVDKPPANGWITGGGLAYQAIPNWDIQPMWLPWMHDLTAQTDVVYTSAAVSWFSMASLGALDLGDGFTEPKASTFQVMSCFATSEYYSGYSGRQDKLSEEFNVGGHKGWHLRTEIYVNMPSLPQVDGDIVDVIVVDLGEPESLGVFLSSATIGDSARIAMVEDAIASLKPA